MYFDINKCPKTFFYEKKEITFFKRLQMEHYDKQIYRVPANKYDLERLQGLKASFICGQSSEGLD